MILRVAMPSKCCCANPGAVPLSELGIQMSEEQEVIITCPSQLTILSESLLEPTMYVLQMGPTGHAGQTGSWRHSRCTWQVSCITTMCREIAFSRSLLQSACVEQNLAAPVSAQQEAFSETDPLNPLLPAFNEQSSCKLVQAHGTATEQQSS